MAASAGVVALAGLAGAAARRVSSTVQAKLRGREPSDTPAKATGTALGLQEGA